MHTRRTYSILTIARRHPLLFSRLAQKPAEPAITVLTTARSAGAGMEGARRLSPPHPHAEQTGLKGYLP